MIIDYENYNTFSGNPVSKRILNVTKERYREIMAVADICDYVKITKITYESEAERKWWYIWMLG